MNAALIEAKNLLIGHGGEALLPPINLTIRPGEFWAVVGRNGSGKTTLFRNLLGLQKPIGGSINRDPALLPSYVPQRAGLDAIVPLRVVDVVSLGMDRGWSFVAERFRGHQAKVHQALEEVGVADLMHMQFHELSEGQKQKVLMARVLASNANLALLDEPTAAMDAVAERETMEAVQRLRAHHGLAVVIVSHFLDVTRKVADKVLFVDRELQVAVTGTPAEVFGSESFRRRYGDLDRRSE